MKRFGNIIFYIFSIVVFFLFLQSTSSVDTSGKIFKERVLETLGNKESIESALVPFIDFDWDKAAVLPYVAYFDYATFRVRYEVRLEFHSLSEKMIRRITLPRLFNIDPDGLENAYFFEISRDEKIKIQRSIGVMKRHGGYKRDLLIDIFP